ncbi:MAG TPA: hypothetical protein PKK37_04785 [Candidatus Pacearchaeota archaeon]|nr:hypothetical protein [Candidatus Pacearchaeota archaeon]
MLLGPIFVTGKPKAKLLVDQMVKMRALSDHLLGPALMNVFIPVNFFGSEKNHALMRRNVA